MSKSKTSDMTVSDSEQAEEYIRRVKDNMQKTADAAAKLLTEDTALESLLKLKFESVGTDPVSGKSCNFIEALNQSFSDLVVFHALLKLFDIYPNAHFKVNAGAKSGCDIVSADNRVYAECFSVVSVKNNRKLKKDAEKLNRKAPEDADKYIFFYTHNDSEELIELAKDYYKKEMNIDLVPLTETDLKN